MTVKYIRITCSCCKKLQHWFKNVDGFDLGGLSNMNSINVQLFRSINQNHVRMDHPSVRFDGNSGAAAKHDPFKSDALMKDSFEAN
jgi:hypothetical protein